MSNPPPGPRVRVAAAVLRADKLLLVQHTKAGASYWMLPGGGLDHGETMHDALARELREETGIHVRPGPLLLVSESISPTRDRHIVHLIFRADYLQGEIQPCDDPRVTDAAWHPLEFLAQDQIYPAVAHELLTALRTAAPAPNPYLGPRWRD